MTIETKKQPSGILMGTMVAASITACCLYTGHVFAAGEQALGLGGIAQNIQDSFSGLASLMLGISYIAGIGFSIAAIFKFKQHKDNPTQIPLGTPIALLVVGISLIFLPYIISSSGQTFFGKSKDEANAEAEMFTVIPGAETTN